MIEPLPYYPNLKKQLRSVTASLLLTYLEIHHPAPPDDSVCISTLPVTIDLDQIARDLQLTRRTLRLTLSQLGVWVRSDIQRLCALRACREFLKSEHTRYGKTKPYSLVGRNADTPGIQLQLRRNKPYLVSILKAAEITDLSLDRPASTSANLQMAVLPVLASPPFFGSQKSNLAEIMMRASVLDGDRRHSRYVGLRKAVKDGLAPKSALSVSRKQKPRDNKDVRKVENEAVYPVLPASILERLTSR